MEQRRLRVRVLGKKIMTTIAAIQGDGFAVLGSDSRITSDGGRIYLLPKEIGKIVRNDK